MVRRSTCLWIARGAATVTSCRIILGVGRALDDPNLANMIQSMPQCLTNAALHLSLPFKALEQKIQELPDDDEVRSFPPHVSRSTPNHLYFS